MARDKTALMTYYKSIAPTIDFIHNKNIISFSQLYMWSKCPYHWKLNYIDKLSSFTDSIHTIFGTAIHETIQYWIAIMYLQSATRAAELDLKTYFKNIFRRLYDEPKNKELFAQTKHQIPEFFHDGINILNYLQSHRDKFFDVRDWEIVGCEVPILCAISEKHKNVNIAGYLDVVLHDMINDRYRIIDLKTSTHGWSEYDKQDTVKKGQVILYKYYFSKQYDIPLDSIDVEYMILKRKIQNNIISPYPITPISQFKPPSGKPTINKLLKIVDDMVDNCFTNTGRRNPDALYEAIHNDTNCRFCEHKNNGHCQLKLNLLP